MFDLKVLLLSLNYLGIVTASLGMLFSSRSDLQHCGGQHPADFASAVDAVQCAVEIQDAIAKQNADRPAGEQMRFRVGIHVGDIIVQADNLFGDAVNIAARLEALAEPGGNWRLRDGAGSDRDKAACRVHRSRLA
jgi:hypothetical protein